MTTLTKRPVTDPPPMTTASSTPPAGSADGTGKKRRLRKEDIVAEATRLFAERGYEGASMGDLAERVGLRKASLFHHFPSKDVLYATVLSELLLGVRTAILTAAMSEGSFGERLDALNTAITTTLGADPYAARLLVREAMDWGPVMRDKLAGTINDVLAAALAFARAGQASGEVKADLDPTQLIVSIIGIHFMPFAIGEIVERFTSTSPFQPAWVEQRTTAVRRQLRALCLVDPA